MGITVQFNSYEEMVEFASKLIGEVKEPVKKVKKTSTPVKEETAVQEETTIEESPVQEEEAPVQEEESTTYALEDVRAKLTELTRAGKQKEVKALITSFGAKNVTTIEPKDYAALMEKAGEL